MKNINDPAYPCPNPRGQYAHTGITKRELIAAMMLQSLIEHMGVASAPNKMAGWALDYTDALIDNLNELIEEGD